MEYGVTRASANDSPQLRPTIENLKKKRHPERVECAEYLTADKVYDFEENNKALWDAYAIRPVIDIRHPWKEEPGHPRLLYPDRVDTLFYTERDQCYADARTTRDRNGTTTRP